jgi:transposase
MSVTRIPVPGEPLEDSLMQKRVDRKRKTSTRVSLLERINTNAAGIDCGSEEHYVAVPADRDPSPVRSFRTFTADLHRLADWLHACCITSVAMEATGVYWIPIYEILEERGIEVVLVNARHVKNVPGRKSDVTDCEWLRDLHSVGLLRGSFRPTAEIVALRTYLRHRETLIQTAASVTQRMQKALIQMNLQLHLVVSDITGVTGLRILRDILAGHTDPRGLARHRDHRCHATEEEIAAALTGHYRAELLFVLKQNLEAFDACQTQIAECDVVIQTHLQRLADRVAGPPKPLPAPRLRRRPVGNEPSYDIRAVLHRIADADLSQVDGITAYGALRLLSEIGTDVSRWPSHHHFTSWLTLAPKNRISGGRILSSRTEPAANRAAVMLRLAAMNVGRTQTALGAFYRRLAARIGKPKAITATARKLAILVYRMLKGEITYADPGAAAYDARRRQAALRNLRKRAQFFGFALLDPKTGQLLEGGVS